MPPVFLSPAAATITSANAALMLVWQMGDFPAVHALAPSERMLWFAESVGISLLLTASLLIYRSVRARYVGIWTAGWAFFCVYRESLIVSAQFGSSRGGAVFLHLCFVLALALLVAAALSYSESSREVIWLLPLALAAAFCGVLRAGWLPDSLALEVVFQLLYHAMAVIGALRLARFSRGRPKMGTWLSAVALVLVHCDTPALSHTGLDLLLDVMLGMGLLLLLVEDSRADKQRLEISSFLTTAIIEARDTAAILGDVQALLRQMLGARVAWTGLREGGHLVLEPHVEGRGEPALAVHEVPVAAFFEESGQRTPLILDPTSLPAALKADAAALRLDHAVVLPLRGSSALLAVLVFGMESRHSYPEEERHFLATLSSHLGLALENSELFTRIMGSHRRWIATFDSINDLILVHDSGQRIIRANLACVRKLGSSLRELPGLTCREVLPNAKQGCPYCLRISEGVSDAPDPCFGGFSTVSTSNYESAGEDGIIHIIRDTTELHVAEERFRLLFEKMQEAVFIAGPDAKLLDCNAAFVSMFGYQDKSEVLGLNLVEVLYPDPELRAVQVQRMEREGMVRNQEVSIIRRDGRRLTVLENSFATYDAAGKIARCQGFLVDITEKTLAEQEIRRSNRELHALNAIAIAAARTFDLAEVAQVALRHAVQLCEAGGGSVLLLDGDSTLKLYASEGLPERAGGDFRYRPRGQFWAEFAAEGGELIAARTLEHLPPELRDAVDSGMRHALAVAMWTSERQPLGLMLVNRCEEPEFVERERELLLTVTRQLAISVERARLYHQTTRAYEHLRNAQEQLLQSEKMSALGRMISGVAHELNNPLTAMIGYTQLLEGEPLGERARDFLGKLYKQTQRTQRIVQSLLSFSRQSKPQRSEVNVERIVEESVALREADLKRNRIQVVRSYARVAPVLADPHQLEQVFVNILNNAMDAILESANSGRVEVSIYEERDFVCVEFHDSGPGVAEPSRIFDPFYTTKKLGKGTGLGLSICYGILKEHGGEITASNHELGGAVLRVRLPRGDGEPRRYVEDSATQQTN